MTKLKPVAVTKSSRTVVRDPRVAPTGRSMSLHAVRPSLSIDDLRAVCSITDHLQFRRTVHTTAASGLSLHANPTFHHDRVTLAFRSPYVVEGYPLMAVPSLLTPFLLVVVLTVTPGSDMVLVLRNGAGGGTTAAWCTGLGCCTGFTAHACADVLGLSTLLAASEMSTGDVNGRRRTTAIRLAGAVYRARRGRYVRSRGNPVAGLLTLDRGTSVAGHSGGQGTPAAPVTHFMVN